MRIGRRGRQGDVPGRGLRRNDSERINAIAHGADVPVEEVLRDVAEFRLALETDMIVAAAAADADAPELLSEMLDGERLELADFHDRLLERLVDAAAKDELAERRARRSGPSRTTRAVSVAAAAVALVGLSRLPAQEQSNNRLALATASQQYADLSSAVTNDSAAAVSEAAAELHQTLETLINEHAGDPEVAQRAATLLQAEINLLQGQNPAGAIEVIERAHSLMILLRQATPPNVRASVAPILDAVQTPSPRPSSSPRPTASPKATSSPKPTASPKPSPKPSASSTSAQDDDEGPLHTP